MSASAVGVLAASIAALTAAAPPKPGSEVSITVVGLRSTHGMVMACLTDRPQEFPKCREPVRGRRLIVPAAARLELHFPGIAPGRYAIALLHDENGNGRIDRMLRMPTEGFGFSNDAPVRMGPPKFEGAAFPVAASPVHQTIRMRYLL